MFSGLLEAVLLGLQGPRIPEDAFLLYKLAVPRGVFVVIDWLEFLKFELQSCDYIFKKNAKETFVKSIDTQLKVIDYLQPALWNDDFNNQIYVRRKRVLSTIKTILEQSVPDENLFVEIWLRTGVYTTPHTAWELYVARLAKCLMGACALWAGENEVSDEDAAEDLGILLAGAFCVNHYMHAGA